jgi:Fe-S-cluster containining protein
LRVGQNGGLTLAPGDALITMTNPCLHCGACCAAFRVSFHWIEAPPALDVRWIERVDAQHLCMAGTNNASPRCAALRGEVGGETTCVAYEARPPACREVQPGDEKCQRARERHGLPPLVTPD